MRQRVLWFFVDAEPMGRDQCIVITERATAAERASAYDTALHALGTHDVDCLGYVELSQEQAERLHDDAGRASYVG